MFSQFGDVIFERFDREPRPRHEAVALGCVACGQALDFKRHDFVLCFGRENAQDRSQGTHPAQRAVAPAHGLWPWEAADRVLDDFGHNIARGSARLFDGCEKHFALGCVALFQLIARKTGAATKPLDRLFRRIDTRAASFFANGRRVIQKPRNAKAQPSRRRKCRRCGIGDARVNQPVCDQSLQIAGGFRLHTRGNFFGKQF